MTFSTVNIIPDTSIGTWNAATSEYTVVRMGVYTISALLKMQNLVNNAVVRSTIIVQGGSQAFSTTQGDAIGSVQLNTIGSLILNPGGIIWVGSRRNVSGSETTTYTPGYRCLNIMYSEIN